MPTATDAISASTRTDSLRENGEAVAVAWRVHPLRDRPAQLSLVAAGYVAAFVLWHFLFPSPLALFLPVVALTGALSGYLFPTTYRVTDRGAHSDCGAARLFIAWADVRRATRGTDGVFLSPFSRPSRLDGFRGVRLRFANGNEAAVLDAVRAMRAKGSS